MFAYVEIACDVNAKVFGGSYHPDILIIQTYDGGSSPEHPP